MSKNVIFVVFIVSSLLFLYQNCSDGFSSNTLNSIPSKTFEPIPSATEPSNPPPGSPGNGDDLAPNPSSSQNNSDDLKPELTNEEDPNKPNKPTIKKSHIFLSGHSPKLCHKVIDHKDLSIKSMPDVDLNGNGQWLTPSPTMANSFYVSEIVNGKTQLSKIVLDQNLKIFKTTAGQVDSKSTHVSIINFDNELFSFHADFSKNNFKATNLSKGSVLANFNFEKLTNPHSTAFDEENSLVFLANMNQNIIKVYKFTPTKLSFLQNIDVPTPRMMVYSKKFKALYLMTEPTSGQSKMIIFKSSPTSGGFEIKKQDEFSTPGFHGSDIKVDEVNEYALGAIREDGKDGVQLVPLTENGLFDRDSGRKALFQKTLPNPRVMDLSTDGRFLTVAFEGKGVAGTVFELSYSKNGGLENIQKLQDFNCSFSSMLGAHNIDQLN